MDAAALADDLKAKGHDVDVEALEMAQEMATVLALNPAVGAAEQRAFLRRFLKNSARAEPEARSVLEM